MDKKTELEMKKAKLEQIRQRKVIIFYFSIPTIRFVYF